MRCPHCNGELELVAGNAGRLDAPRQRLELAEAIADFRAEKRVTGEWSEGWAVSARAYLARFEEFMHTREAWGMDAGREDVAAWKQDLLRQGLTPSTINAHLVVVGNLFRWAQARGIVAINPVEGQRLRVNGKASEGRAAFTPAEVARVLEAVRLGEGVPTAARLLVEIMAYTGARSEEVAQLRVGDVRQVEGAWVFDFAADGEGLRRKNEASRRLVPIHPRVMPLVWVDAPAHANLLGLAGKRKAHGPSRWFNKRLLPKLVAAGEVAAGRTLYSLRHSVATQLKHKRVPEPLIAQLLGHANQSITTGRYGKDYPVQELVGVVAEIEW